MPSRMSVLAGLVGVSNFAESASIHPRGGPRPGFCLGSSPQTPGREFSRKAAPMNAAPPPPLTRHYIQRLADRIDKLAATDYRYANAIDLRDAAFVLREAVKVGFPISPIEREEPPELPEASSASQHVS